MNIELGFIDQMVNKIAKDLNTKLDSNKEKQISKAFTFLTLKTILDIEDEEVVLDCLYDGSGDYGIDGLYVSDLANDSISIKIFQTKYKRVQKQNGDFYDGESNFPSNDIGKMLGVIKTIFDPSKELSGVVRGLREKIEEIRSFVADGIIPKIDIYMCNNGRKWNDAAKQEIENAALPHWVSFEHINHKKIIAMIQSRENVSDKIQFSGKAIVENYDYKRVMIGKVKVTEFHKLFKTYGDKLLEKNVRKFLGTKSNIVNEAIKKTLLSQNNSDFFFLNNGVTIVVSKFSHNELQEKDFMVNLENIHIINGGQTCKTIEETIESNPNHDFSKANVLVRIYELSNDDEDIIDSITYATNSQTAVNLRDLKANDPIQRKLIESVELLETDNNNNPVYTYKPKRDSNVSKNSISIAVAAEAIISTWRRGPHRAKFRKNRLFEDEIYETIFTSELNAAQLVIAVHIWRYVETKRKTDESLYNDYIFVGYCSNHLCMIMGDKLLKENSISLEQLTHINFKNIKKYFEKNKERLHKESMEIIAEAMSSDNINLDLQSASLQKIAASFRRAYLTYEIQRLLDGQ